MKYFNKLPVELLQLSNRALNALIKSSIYLISDLEDKTLSDLYLNSGVGRKSLKEIYSKYYNFTQKNLELGDNKDVLGLFSQKNILEDKLSLFVKYKGMNTSEYAAFRNRNQNLSKSTTKVLYGDREYYLTTTKLDPMRFFEVYKNKVNYRTIYIYEEINATKGLSTKMYR